MVKRFFPILFLATTVFGQTTFDPTEDAYVQYTAPTSSFGTAADLRIRNTSTESLFVFIQFNVTGLSGTVSDCSLRAYVTLGGASSAGDLRQVTDDSWTEAVTWNTKPAFGSVINAMPAATLNTWIITQCVSYVTGNDTWSFGIKANSSQNTRLESEENAAAHEPTLVVYTVAGGVTRRKIILGIVAPPDIPRWINPIETMVDYIVPNQYLFTPAKKKRSS